MPLDDLPLRDPAAPPPAPALPRRAGPSRLVVFGAVFLVAATLMAFWWLGRAQPDPAPPAYATATDVPVTSPRPKPQPVDVPPLDASDEFLRRILGALSANPALAKLLATPSLVRGATLTVVQLGNGRTPATPLKVLQPAQRLSIAAGASGTIDPASYKRWDAATGALTSLPPGQVAQVYVNVKSLFDQAYHELGFPTEDFDAAIVRAMNTLIDTPVPASDPVLLRRPGYFEHDDSALKSRLPAQRQFLLLGPANQRRVVTWLRQLASSLDLKVR